MMSLSPRPLSAVAQTQLFTDGCAYVYLRFPSAPGDAVKSWLSASLMRFFCLMWDENEISLMIKRDDWELAPPSLQPALVSPIYRRITFDVFLEFDLVGYLAAITKLLASHNITILAFSAFSRDHLFVQQSDFDRAWKILQAYIRRSSEKQRLLIPRTGE
jgi:hypothetical protein